MPPWGVAEARGRGCSDYGELWSRSSARGARLGKPGDRQSGCDGDEEQVARAGAALVYGRAGFLKGGGSKCRVFGHIGKALPS